MWWLYQVLLVVAWPVVLVRLRWRARREPAYGQRIGERFGHVPANVPAGTVWFHTVSAGETIAAAPLIGALASANPGPVLVTTMTPTGSAQVTARLTGTEPQVHHCYAPYDFPWGVRRFFDRVQPRLLVLMETELWPNLIDTAARRNVPVLLVNARLSERSARGYARLGGLTRRMLGQLECIACQYPDHATRFSGLGADPGRIDVLGSVKFDQALPADHSRRVARLEQRFDLSRGPVWIAASTHPGEEERVLAAHRRVLERVPDARLILVPRHPARTAAVEKLCRAEGFRCARQSAPHADDPAAAVVLGDTMGELIYLYGTAAVAFVGGSFFGLGGHNPIEPALCGVPVVMGPDDFNFTDVVAVFREAEGLVVVTETAELADRVADWLTDTQAARAAGQRAQWAVATQRGATERLQTLLQSQIDTLH